MFPLGHVGLVVGAIIAGLLIARRPDVLGKVDFRIVAVLAMLPDIIDKPLGHFVLGETLNNGRIYAHTLVFLVLVAIICIIVVCLVVWSVIATSDAVKRKGRMVTKDPGTKMGD